MWHSNSNTEFDRNDKIIKYDKGNLCQIVGGDFADIKGNFAKGMRFRVRGVGCGVRHISCPLPTAKAAGVKFIQPRCAKEHKSLHYLKGYRIIYQTSLFDHHLLVCKGRHHIKIGNV